MITKKQQDELADKIWAIVDDLDALDLAQYDRFNFPYTRDCIEGLSMEAKRMLRIGGENIYLWNAHHAISQYLKMIVELGL